MNEIDTKKKRLDTTHWLLIIAVVVLVEGLIAVGAVWSSHDGTLVTQVGFGATLLSIVLAVVAIAYAFFQGEAQNISSTRIAENVGALAVTSSGLSASVGTLKLTASELEKDRTQLLEAISRLNLVAGTVESVKADTGALATQFISFQKLIEAKGQLADKEHAAPADAEDEQPALRLGLIAPIAILLAKDAKKIPVQFGNWVARELLKKEDWGSWSAGLEAGFIGGAILAFEMANQISIDDDRNLTMKPAFRERMKAAIESVTEGAEAKFKETRASVAAAILAAEKRQVELESKKDAKPGATEPAGQ